MKQWVHVTAHKDDEVIDFLVKEDSGDGAFDITEFAIATVEREFYREDTDTTNISFKAVEISNVRYRVLFPHVNSGNIIIDG